MTSSRIWAKRDAGIKPPKPPLPPRIPGDVGIICIGQYETHRRTEDEIISEIPVLPTYDESLDEMRERFVKLIGKVAYPPLKTKTHPIILKFLSQDEERKSEYAKNPFNWNKQVFDTPIEKRRLRLLNAIFLSFWLYARETGTCFSPARPQEPAVPRSIRGRRNKTNPEKWATSFSLPTRMICLSYSCVQHAIHHAQPALYLTA